MNIKPRYCGGSPDPSVQQLAKAHRALDKVRDGQAVEGGEIAWALEVTGDSPLVMCPWPPTEDRRHAGRPPCMSERLRRFLLAMPPLTCAQIASMTGMNRKNTRAHLKILVTQGQAFMVTERAHLLFTVCHQDAKARPAPVKVNQIDAFANAECIHALRPAGTWEGGITEPARFASIFSLEAA